MTFEEFFPDVEIQDTDFMGLSMAVEEVIRISRSEATQVLFHGTPKMPSPGPHDFMKYPFWKSFFFHTMRLYVNDVHIFRMKNSLKTDVVSYLDEIDVLLCENHSGLSGLSQYDTSSELFDGMAKSTKRIKMVFTPLESPCYLKQVDHTMYFQFMDCYK